MSVRPVRPRHRWPGLDGLRALAVVAVLGFHFAPSVVPGGFLGVDVFFVLSGYLITRMIVGEYLRTGRFGFRHFYVRRARRLLPGLVAVLVACLAAAAFWRDQLTTIRSATLAAAGYVSNWWLSFAHESYFVAAGRPSMLQHLWSLAVEEQFYLLWPVVAVAVLVWCGRRARASVGARLLAGAAALLAVGSATEMFLLARAEDAPYGADASRLYYGTDTHSMGLLLGAAVGAFVAARASQRPVDAPEQARRGVWLTDALATASLIGLGVSVLTVNENDPRLYRGGFLLVAALAAAATGALARPDSRLGHLLDARPLRWVAARSYAIYLWHWPVAVVTRPGIDLHWPAPTILLLRVAITVLLADLTHRFVEVPVRYDGLRGSLRNGVHRLGRVVAGRAPIGARLVAAAAGCLVLMAGGVLAAAPRPTLSAGQRALAQAHGGRDLPLGTLARRPPASPVAHIASGIEIEAPAAATVRHATVSRPADALPSVSAYGDSVMLGARAALDRRFPRGRMNAVEGRQPDPILRDVDADAARGRLYPLVVIGVGDNGLITPDQLSRTLASLRHVPRVVLINNRVGRAWEAPNNRTIARVAAQFRNVRLLDWHAASARHPDWFYEDHIHLTPRGAAAYSSLIADAARRP